nr:hypothetical protein CFP56_01935 [Quercus suber]
MGDVSKEDLVVTPPPAHSPTKCPASPTSSLELIAFVGEEARKKKKVGGKSFLPTFWDDADAVALKAHETLSVDDLSPLMAKSSSEALGESLFVYGKLLELEKRMAMSEPMIKSLFAKNETFKNKYYVEGFDPLMKWMAKHHPDLDLFGLVMGDVEKELLSDRPSEATAKNVTEEATIVAEVMEEVSTIAPADPVPNE